MERGGEGSPAGDGGGAAGGWRHPLVIWIIRNLFVGGMILFPEDAATAAATPPPQAVITHGIDIHIQITSLRFSPGMILGSIARVTAQSIGFHMLLDVYKHRSCSFTNFLVAGLLLTYGFFVQCLVTFITTSLTRHGLRYIWAPFSIELGISLLAVAVSADEPLRGLLHSASSFLFSVFFFAMAMSMFELKVTQAPPEASLEAPPEASLEAPTEGASVSSPTWNSAGRIAS